MMSYAYGYRSVTANELDNIVNRLSRPTEASKSWKHNYNAQDTHINHLKSIDPKFHAHKRRSASPEKLDMIVRRLRTPTRASSACSYDFDNQEANLVHLQKKDPYISVRMISRPGSRASSRISVNGQLHEDSQKDGRQSANSNISGTTRYSVSSRELDNIVDRLTRPTVASRGGVDLMHKKYEYIPIPRLKTLPFITGLDERYMGNKKVSQGEFNELVGRLTKSTKASLSKSAPDPHSR